MNINFVKPEFLNIKICELQYGGLFACEFTSATDDLTGKDFIEVVWYQPLIDIHCVWSCGTTVSKNLRVEIDSSLTTLAPIACFMNNQGMNRYSVAFSDCLNPSRLIIEVHEESSSLQCSLKFSPPATVQQNHKAATLLIDLRSVPYYEALQDIAHWYEQAAGYQPLSVPACAKQPMYSTWYSFHQNLDPVEIENQCLLARDLGFSTIIVDDGWQTDDNNRRYAFVGDWSVTPAKFPDFKAHVQRVHDLGMKFMLWFSVPYVGIQSAAWNQFKDKLLYFSPDQKAGILDLRYPEVRQYLLGIYDRFVLDYDIDGLKLDFIDEMVEAEADPLQMADAEGRDLRSVPVAVDIFLRDLITRVQARKPEFMYEFRQKYTGPAMRQYGNIFRVADCPNDYQTNRVNSIDLRLLAGNTAVHSDMIMWNQADRVENAALQLINVLFAVPQFSMRIDELSAEHARMSRFYLEFMSRNADVLLDGQLMPYYPALHYPVVESRTEDKCVIAVYGQFAVHRGKNLPRLTYIINGTLANEIIFDFAQPCQGTMVIYNCQGQVVHQSEVSFMEGPAKISVPAAGLIELLNA